MTESAKKAKADLAIRPANAADIPELAAVLARAFAQDPFACWLAHPERDKATAMALAFQLQLKHLAMPGGLVFCVEDRSGAALWSAPGNWDLTLWQQIRFAPAFAGVVGWTRLLPVLKAVQAVQRAHPREPHYYLQVLGVDPVKQGRGQGRALLEPMLAKADRQQVPVYLETAEPDNLGYYQRFGFEVRQELDLPSGAPHLWTMLRPPSVQPA